MTEDTVTWTCPNCGTLNHEVPETVLAECEWCGQAHDMPAPQENPTP